MQDRVSRQELQEIEARLGDRDKSILNTILEYRYLTTDLIQRLYFTDHSTSSAALRATSRNLNKLKELDLIRNVERRIGGVRSGSGSYIWQLAPAGHHLLRLKGSKARPLPRNFEPSLYFLIHILSVAETHVRFHEICRKKGMKLVTLQNEPENRRKYNKGGKIVSLQPDLFAVTICDDYEDRWFIEVDLDTESPCRIIEKCDRYHEYYRSGLEQKENEVFPLVVWIVPDAERKESITKYIQKEFAKQTKIFTVVTPDELETLVCQGADASGRITLC